MMKKWNFKRLIIKSLLIAVFAVRYDVGALVAQQIVFSNETVDWSGIKKVEVPKELPANHPGGCVFIEDAAEFTYIGKTNLIRLMTVKIEDASGAAAFSRMKFPESFDLAHDQQLNLRGTKSRVQVPNHVEYRLIRFGARKLSRGHWANVPFDYSYSNHRREEANGEAIKEDALDIVMNNIQPGDVVQVLYESTYEKVGNGTPVYLYGPFDKLNVDYIFKYRDNPNFNAGSKLLTVNIPDSCYKRTTERADNMNVISYRIKMKNVGAVRYPIHSMTGKTQPHVCFDSYLISLYGSKIFERTKKGIPVPIIYGAFGWAFALDTTYQYTRIYDSYFNSLRKFSNTLPPVYNDSLKLPFVRAFADTMNAFKYYTAMDVFYNQPQYGAVNTMGHVERRRIIENDRNLLEQILEDKGIAYYDACLQDKRLGINNTKTRDHDAYERVVFCFSEKDSYLFYIPRTKGVKYLANELPFYFENNVAALFPRNIMQQPREKREMQTKFIKTAASTASVNTRTENATIKFDQEKTKAAYQAKLSLSGQFSTICRHAYFRDPTDSTVHQVYFKKCTDKPNMKDVKIKLSSKSEDMPFRHTFNCSGNLEFNKAVGDLTGWFSFVLNRSLVNEPPTCDYFFDFEGTDMYNLVLEFADPTTILNAADFKRSLSNDYFELETGLQKQTETSYLMSVKFVIKKDFVKREDASLLTNIVKELETLNSFKLQL